MDLGQLMKINEVSELIKKEELDGGDGAYKKFEEYIQDIKSLGGFASGKWDPMWREKVCEFGELFRERNANRFIQILDEEVEGDCEVVDFIRSEIVTNYYHRESDIFPKYIKDLVEKYPLNPEFHNSYGNYLRIKDKLSESIVEYKTALRIGGMDKSCRDNCFNAEMAYFNRLIEDDKIEEANLYFKKMSDFDQYKSPTLNNMLVTLRHRLEDHKIINEKIKSIDKIIEEKIDEMDKSIREKVEKERNRFIEILGVFAAFLGFVFTNVNIALSNLEPREVMFLMLEMAVVFLIFAISISYIFQQDRKEFYEENKFWVLVVLFLVILALICYSSFSGVWLIIR